MTWQEVAARLKEAAQTLRSMPMDKPRGYRCQMPDVVHDRADQQVAYGYYGDPDNLYRKERQMPDIRFTPSPAEIDRMDECLSWLQWLPKRRGMIVEAYARGIRARRIAGALGVKPITIRREFRRGCQIIAEKILQSGCS